MQHRETKADGHGIGKIIVCLKFAACSFVEAGRRGTMYNDVCKPEVVGEKR